MHLDSKTLTVHASYVDWPVHSGSHYEAFLARKVLLGDPLSTMERVMRSRVRESGGRSLSVSLGEVDVSPHGVRYVGGGIKAHLCVNKHKISRVVLEQYVDCIVLYSYRRTDIIDFRARRSTCSLLQSAVASDSNIATMPPKPVSKRGKENVAPKRSVKDVATEDDFDSALMPVLN